MSIWYLSGSEKKKGTTHSDLDAFLKTMCNMHHNNITTKKRERERGREGEGEREREREGGGACSQHCP